MAKSSLSYLAIEWWQIEELGNSGIVEFISGGIF